MKEDDHEDMLKLANLYHDDGHFEKAKEAYLLLLKYMPLHVEARTNLASVFVGLEEFDNAIKEASAVVKTLGLKSLASVTALYTRGEAHFQKGNYRLAICDCTLALKLKPSFPEALCVRGASFNALGNWQKAADDLSKALCIRPGYKQALQNRGLAFCKLGFFVQAKKDFESIGHCKEDVQKWLDLAERKFKEEDKKARNAAASLLEDFEEVKRAEVLRKGKKRRQKKKQKEKKKTIKIKKKMKEKIQKSTKFEKSTNAVKSHEKPLKTKPAPKKISSPSLLYSSVEPRVKQSLHEDLFQIEVAAIVDTAFAVGTARVVGKNHCVNEELALK